MHITPAMRVVSMNKKKVIRIREAFREVFLKHVRGGVGTDLTWRLDFGTERPKNVIHRIKVILSWVYDDDVYTLTDQEVFRRLIYQYTKLVSYFKGSYYDEYYMVKYGEIDL